MKGKQKFLAVLFGVGLCVLAGCKDMFHPEGSLAPPSSIRATAASSSSIAVSWSSVEGASDYRLYRATSSGGTYSGIASTSSVSYMDEDLTANTAYYYKVRVHNSTGDGDFSAVATATTLAASSAISPPSTVSATAASSSSITVSWGPAAGASAYTLYRSTSVSGTYSRVTSTSSSSRSYTDSGLTANTTYYYKVSASDSSGGSGSMSSVYGYATTFASSSSLSPPLAVSATAASSSSITVSWGPVSGAGSYRIYRSTSGYGTYSYVTSASGTSYTDSGLSSNTAYYYKVSAYSSSYGESSMSSSYGYATTSASSSWLSPPSSVSATAASSSSITVSWGSVSGVSGYNVYRSTSGYGTYSYVIGVSGTSYTDTGLSPNTTYYYKVSAFDYNSYDESSMSSVYGYATTSEGGLTATPSNLSLAESLTWISNNAVEGGAYTITLNADESIAPQTLYYNDKSVSITLDGGSVERTVSLSSTGSLFTIYSGVTLTLENNVTLQGRSDNTSSLVQMSGSYWYSSGALVMNDGSKITGNTSYGYGGGVYVSDGTFTMNGGEISGNTSSSSYGGGYGGGVYVSSGTFTMSGGEISGNTVSTTSYYAANGGGVTVSSGTFEMSGGEISGNTAYSSGGGVDVGDGAFTMTGGIVSGNTASHSGGGVYAGSGTFTMSGGAISGNTSGYDGGGVYVISGTFTKQGGTIYGSNADSSLKNTATSGSGHAVYVYSDSKMRNATADSSVNLDSSVSGAAGGWENGSVQISLQPTPTSPTLSNASLLVNESASFSVEYGYNSYAWYWNGEPTGAASYDYYLAANSRTPGIYELSVVVTNSAGKTLSARCRVVINAN